MDNMRMYDSLLLCYIQGIFKLLYNFWICLRMSRETQNKYPTLCTHDFQKSLTNEVELHCNQEHGLVHKISQYGKICNKCTQIIKDSYTGSGDCIICIDSIQQYLKDRELCQHQIRQLDEIQIKCLNDSSVNHDVLFKSQICKKCCDKVRAAFMNSKICKICEGRQNQVIKDLEKVYISPSYSHIKNILSLLQASKANDSIYKNQIESACKAFPKVTRQQNGIVPNKLIDEYNSEDKEDAHISKRYNLYPKCRKHKSNFINVCNSCLVALLNLDCCPYGCMQEGKNEAKTKKQVNVRYYQTGFLNIYPQFSKNSYYLELFVIKLIEEKSRLDRWEINLKKIIPKSAYEEKFVDKFALYSSVVALGKDDFLVCGGVTGKFLDQMKPTSHSYIITISSDRKDFLITQISPLNIPRSGHSLVYNEKRKTVFAIGGYSRQTGFIKETEIYSLDSKQWLKTGDLNVERSKTTACLFEDNVYVFGGLTSNQRIKQAHAQKFNFQNKKWEELVYNGYDSPFTTNSTASTSILPFQTKNNLLFFGGSNIEGKTNLIQKLIIKQKSFQIDYRSYLVLQYPRQSCVLGLINQETIICFGGVPQHEPFLAIDVVKIKPNEKEVQTIYVNDQIQLGSYRSVAREDSQKLYAKLKDQLKRFGLISQEQKQLMKDEGLVTPFNCQLIQKLWFTIGKNYVWLPL